MEGIKTINIKEETKARLDSLKILPEEIYDNEINRLLDKLEKNGTKHKK